MDTNSAYNRPHSNREMYAPFQHAPIKQGPFALTSLLSPPEPKRQDSFQTSPSFSMSRTPSSSSNYTVPQYTMTKSKQAPSLISPPVSPQTAAKEQGRRDEGDGARDPVLFPSGQDMTVATEPLFSPVERIDELIDEHVAARIATGVVNAPPAEDYRVIVEALSQIRFQSSVSEAIRKVTPQVWTRDEIKWEKHYLAQGPQKGKKKLTSPSYRPLAPAPAGVQKSRVTIPRTKNQPKTKRVTQTPQPSNHVLPQSVPSPTHTPRAVKNSAFFDNWAQLPDYCPPFPDNFGSKSLKADWKGAALDLSNDVFRQELHPAELNLASTLRLGCAMYLTSKRQIFNARREALKIGKEFRKTDAQQACNIDVNKASKLWTAFEKVGWFNEEHFR
ncbi:hypothetical protein FKW77_003121 [Venturia effusa]|uniref:SWIRM domain-containing protein n=1 Tax=Venturia effusa TaxID=50376 RepID=A0A517LMG6_9PEZI|nr:hypothetical protein FKW77_003121 [Venturia effusa]